MEKINHFNTLQSSTALSTSESQPINTSKIEGPQYFKN